MAYAYPPDGGRVITVGMTPYRGPRFLPDAAARRGSDPMMLGGVLAPARLMVGKAEAALCAAGITLVQLAGTASGPSEAALPRLPITPDPSEPIAPAPALAAPAAALAAPEAAAPAAFAAAIAPFAKPCPVWAMPRMDDIPYSGVAAAMK